MKTHSPRNCSFRFYFLLMLFILTGTIYGQTTISVPDNRTGNVDVSIQHINKGSIQEIEFNMAKSHGNNFSYLNGLLVYVDIFDIDGNLEKTEHLYLAGYSGDLWAYLKPGFSHYTERPNTVASVLRSPAFGGWSSDAVQHWVMTNRGNGMTIKDFNATNENSKVRLTIDLENPVFNSWRGKKFQFKFLGAWRERTKDNDFYGTVKGIEHNEHIKERSYLRNFPFYPNIIGPQESELSMTNLYDVQEISFNVAKSPSGSASTFDYLGGIVVEAQIHDLNGNFESAEQIFAGGYSHIVQAAHFTPDLYSNYFSATQSKTVGVDYNSSKSGDTFQYWVRNGKTSAIHITDDNKTDPLEHKMKLSIRMSDPVFNSWANKQVRFVAYGAWYDRDGSGTEQRIEGASNFFWQKEEQQYEDLGFSVTKNEAEGYNTIKFKAEFRNNENLWDFINCMTIEYNNASKKANYNIANAFRNNSCNAYEINQGKAGSFTVTSVANNIQLNSYLENGDFYIELKHFYPPEDIGDNITYYLKGEVEHRDIYGITETKYYDYSRNNVNITNNLNFELPLLSNLSTAPSASQCAITINWTPPTSSYGGTAAKNKTFVYRDGIVIAELDRTTTSFSDTNVQSGIDYIYGIAAAYERPLFGDAIGVRTSLNDNPTRLEEIDAPNALTVDQASCGSNVTVTWGWNGDNPSKFRLERKTETTAYVAISEVIDGSNRSYTDTNNIESGEVYIYRIAAIDGPCATVGKFTDPVALTGDTLDITVAMHRDDLETSKGYFSNRTELFWSTTGENDQYLDRFKIYARELGTTVVPTLLQTVNESTRTWFHETGNAGTLYEYFIVGERVVETDCGNLVTSTFSINSLENVQTEGNLPPSGNGLAYAVGFRYPTGIVNGNMTYEGGIAVADVKVTVDKYDGTNGKSLNFTGAYGVAIDDSNDMPIGDAFTISSWVKIAPNNNFPAIAKKTGVFGLFLPNGESVQFSYWDKDGTELAIYSKDISLPSATWVNIATTYNLADKEVKLYINGQLNATKSLPANFELATQQTGLELGVWAFNGNMTDVRIYTRTLSDEEILRTHGAVVAADRKDLWGYWKTFEGVGNKIYDISHQGSTFNRHDGTLYPGVFWSDDIPSSAQLGNASYTDKNGNYSVSGIGYSGVGENFNVSPSIALGGAIHEFDPNSRTLFIGQGSAIHNSIDFTDISSFKLSGSILFAFNDQENIDFQSAGSEGIRMYLNGTVLLTDANNQPIETDANGHFEVDIPIGHNYIEFRKNGHTLSDNGRFPKEGTWEFLEDVHGVQLWDNTKHIFRGLVVGGTAEAEKPVGFGKTKNNIGQAKFTLTSSDGKITREITTDTETGEFYIELPPKKYTSSSVKYVSNNVDIVNSSDIAPIELNSIFTYNTTYETDSIFNNEDELIGIDSISYNLRKDFVYRTLPELLVTSPSGGAISGEKTYRFDTGNGIVNLDLTSLPFPTFQSGKEYDLLLSAAEVYTNIDTQSKDTVFVTDGFVTINNNIGTGFYKDGDQKIAYPSPEVIEISEGNFRYQFKAMEPNINEVSAAGLEHTSFTKQLNIKLTVGDNVVSWPNASNPNENLLAYVLGSKAVGNSLVTQAPPTVEFILRDPPGSNSYAFWEQSTTHTSTQDYYVGGFLDITLDAGIGVGTNTLVGGGIMGVGEIAETHLFGTVGFNSYAEIGGGGEFTQSTTFDETIETNAEPIQIGSSDVYVAKSQNLQTGLSVQIRPVAISKCGGDCYGDIIYAEDGSQYRMTRVFSNYVNPVGIPTYFNYSESHIVNVLIPDLEEIRNTFLTTQGNDYTSKIAPNHALYGSNNDDPLWGSDVSTSNHIKTEIEDFDGESYTFNYRGDDTRVDSVRYFNQQIRLWKEALANNEIEKWMAKENNREKENISMSSGNTLTKSKTTSNSSFKYTSFETSTSASLGLDTAFDGWGFGFQIVQNNELGLRTSGSFSDGQEHSLTTGYVLHDADEDDFFSVDVYPSEDKSGPIFRTVGGQSMCPFEDKIVMEYTTISYVETLIAIHKGDLNKAEQERLAFGVSGDTDEEGIKYGEVTQIQSSLDNLEALLAALKKGEVVLSNATLQRDKPSLLINGAKSAQAFNVLANQPANFNLLLQNESESTDAQYYGIKVLNETNPNGLILKIDGEPLVNGSEFLVPGGSAIQKVLTVEKGPYDYNYENVQLLIHSTCQYDPTSNDALIGDTVSFNVKYLPVCSPIEIISPNDQFTVNNSFNDKLPITIGGYDVNSTGFEKVKVLYKPSSSQEWTLLNTFYRDATLVPDSSPDSPILPETGNTFTYVWDLDELPDGDYDIQAIAECPLAETTSVIHSGIMDRKSPQSFGQPQPSNGVLAVGEELSIKFNEAINSAALSTQNFDIRGVLNAGEIRHDASVLFDGSASSYLEIEQVNLNNRSITIEFYAKRSQNGVKQAIISQGTDANSAFVIGYDTSNKLFINVGNDQIQGGTPIDNNWHHIAFVYDLEHENGEIFVDGSLDGINNSFSPQYPQNVHAYVGLSKLGGINHFSGNVHELRIWNSTLSESDINIAGTTRMIGNERGLLYNWEMEEAKGTIAKDKVRGKHAKMAANWVVEPTGYALAFAGIADYASLDELSFERTDDFTVEFWFKSNGGTNEVLFSNGSGEIENLYMTGWVLGLNAGGDFFAKSNGETLTALKGNDGTWHHIALVATGTGNTVLYFDGKETDHISSSALQGFGGATVWLGEKAWYSEGDVLNKAEQFSGKLDELRIWNTARSLSQISRDSHNKLSGSEPGLISYYPFETYQESQGVYSVVTSTKNTIIGDPLLIKPDIAFSGASDLVQDTPLIKMERPVNSIPFTYVINHDEIILTPVIEDWKIENTQLDITVTNVKDLNGNSLSSPITWTTYVDKNQVVWKDNLFDFSIDKGNELKFTTEVINSSGQSKSFSISNLPNWLSVSPQNGNISPLNSVPVEFTVSKQVQNGTYLEDIFLTSDFDFAEKLTLNLKVKEALPADWAVDESAYQSSMNVIGQIAFDNVLSRNSEDYLGVFVNDECRGIAHLDYVSSYDNYQTFLTIYGEVEGEELEFRIWKTSIGKVFLDIQSDIPSTTFTANAFYGTPSNPLLFNSTNAVQGDIPIQEGWNWIAFNLKDGAITDTNKLLENLDSEPGDIFKTRLNIENGGSYSQQPFFSVYSSQQDWNGSVPNASVGALYKLKASNAGSIRYDGSFADLQESTINLVPKWNYIGYLGTTTAPLEVALSNYQASTNDIIKSQNQAAIYDENFGWIGNLKFLNPNAGYMLYSEQAISFKYPAYTTQARNATPIEVDQSPWKVSANNAESNMTVVARLQDGFENGYLGAFVNEDCVAYSKPYTTSDGITFYLLTISGEGKDEIHYKFFDADYDSAYEVIEKTSYTPDSMVGQIESPLELTISSGISTSVGMEAPLYIYPIPARDGITMEITANSAQNTRINVETVSGKLVHSMHVDLVEGKNTIEVPRGNFAEGVYIFRLIVDNNQLTEKVIFTK